MAFEGLTEKLSSAFKKLRNKGRLTESDVKEAMREIRLALLEADVSYKVVKDFIKAVTEKAVGTEVLESLTPAQQVIKIVNVGFPYGRRQCKNYHCLPATNCGDDGGSAGRWKDHQRCKAGRPDAEAEWEAPSFSCL